MKSLFYVKKCVDSKNGSLIRPSGDIRPVRAKTGPFWARWAKLIGDYVNVTMDGGEGYTSFNNNVKLTKTSYLKLLKRNVSFLAQNRPFLAQNGPYMVNYPVFTHLMHLKTESWYTSFPNTCLCHNL